MSTSPPAHREPVVPPTPTNPSREPALAAEPTVPQQSIRAAALQTGDPMLVRILYETERRIRDTREVRDVAAQIGQLSWGKNLSEHARFAMANWCAAAGVDPNRHIDVLGDNIYDNAELYLDKLAAMPDFFDHADVAILAPLDTRPIDAAVVGDKEAKRLLEEQRKVNATRLALQIEHAVPADINQFPDTAAAVLVTLHFKDGTTARGVNWSGSRGRSKQSRSGPGGAYDPVGDLEPVKTATTRAYRKAAKQKVPVWFKQGQFGELFERAERLMAESRARAKAAGVDDTPIVVPDGSPRFQKAMRLGLEHERAKMASGHRALGITADDLYAPETPLAAAPATVAPDGTVTREVITEPVRPEWACARCGELRTDAPAVVEPSPEGGTFKFCAGCVAEQEESGRDGPSGADE